VNHHFRQTVSVVLVVCLLAPTVATAQSFDRAGQPGQSVVPATPRSPGTFTPFTPSRIDAGAGFGTTNRNIAGPDYRLGPGDVLDVQIAGRVDVTRIQVVVDPEGALNIPPLGAIEVGGLTLLEANRKIAERARAVFRYADVSVAVIAPRAFEVVVAGEVERPGTMQVIATQRLHEVILTAGGITPRGSVRHVQVTEKGLTREVDLLAFELRGDLRNNPFVREDMRINVPPRGAAVMLTGAVRRPGEYELATAGSLREVLDLTGGLIATSALSEARLTRVGPQGRKETVSIDLRSALAAAVDVTLQSGDVLYVPPLTVLQDVVEVRGAFNGTQESSKTATTGKATIVQRLELAQGDRVRDIVIRAGGA
jgi:polysaccharide export outer membrane protein